MLHRRTATRESTTAPKPDIEQIDVTRLELLLDGGIPLSYDLETNDSFTDITDGNVLAIQVGERSISISKNRILYIEVRPAKVNRVRPSGSI